MMEPLRRASKELFCRPGETWVLLDEHQLHSRIPDLVVARIDLDALAARLAGGWGRALRPGELRALRSLRPDRGRSLHAISRELGVGEARAHEILRGLVAEEFVERTETGTFARRAPIQPVLDYVVSIEAKRVDLRRAFSQAHANGAFADVSIVAFDLAHRTRAEAMGAAYASEGLGLLGLSAEGRPWEYIVRPRRSRLFAALGRALAAEQTFARLLGTAVRRLPQTRLPGDSHATASPSAPQLFGPVPKGLARSLPGCAPRRRRPALA